MSPLICDFAFAKHFYLAQTSTLRKKFGLPALVALTSMGGASTILGCLRFNFVHPTLRYHRRPTFSVQADSFCVPVLGVLLLSLKPFISVVIATVIVLEQKGNSSQSYITRALN